MGKISRLTSARSPASYQQRTPWRRAWVTRLWRIRCANSDWPLLPRPCWLALRPLRRPKVRPVTFARYPMPFAIGARTCGIDARTSATDERTCATGVRTCAIAERISATGARTFGTRGTMADDATGSKIAGTLEKTSATGAKMFAIAGRTLSIDARTCATAARIAATDGCPNDDLRVRRAWRLLPLVAAATLPRRAGAPSACCRSRAAARIGRRGACARGRRFRSR